MATLRKLVSDVRAMHKLLSTDNLITDRVVASEIKNNTLLLVKRETNLRKLWATDTLFTTIPCLELVEVPISECCDYVDPCTVARTKYEQYYWISNGYLYVNNPLLQAIRIAAFFEEDVPNEIMFAECCCSDNINLEEYCKNPLDKEYGCPGYLEKQVLELTSQKLLSTYFRLKTDQTSDGVDGQAPNTTNAN